MKGDVGSSLSRYSLFLVTALFGSGLVLIEWGDAMKSSDQQSTSPDSPCAPSRGYLLGLQKTLLLSIKNSKTRLRRLLG